MQDAENYITVLCLGDVVGRSGRRLVGQRLRSLKEEHGVDVAIVNGENASGGVGLSAESAEALFDAGADVLTTGDHVWKMRDLVPLLKDSEVHCIRPANYPTGTAGLGHTIFELKDGFKLGVLNLIGRVFTGIMADCPFRVAERYFEQVLSGCDAVVVDMHAEATSEKLALARYLDGRASLVYGTHTHTQTADEQILPKGTGFISDLGMCGPYGGVIGMSADVALARFLTSLPHAYKTAKGPAMINGIVAKLARGRRAAISIERLRIFE